MTALSNGEEWRLRERGEPDHRGRGSLVTGEFPEYEWKSPTLTLVEDLVHSLDTGEPPRGGVRAARASTELIFAVIESHLRGGARVTLPLEGSTIRMERGMPARQPRFQRQDGRPGSRFRPPPSLPAEGVTGPTGSLSAWRSARSRLVGADFYVPATICNILSLSAMDQVTVMNTNVTRI